MFSEKSIKNLTFSSSSIVSYCVPVLSSSSILRDVIYTDPLIIFSVVNTGIFGQCQAVKTYLDIHFVTDSQLILYPNQWTDEYTSSSHLICLRWINGDLNRIEDMVRFWRDSRHFLNFTKHLQDTIMITAKTGGLVSWNEATAPSV